MMAGLHATNDLHRAECAEEGSPVQVVVTGPPRLRSARCAASSS